MSIQVAGRTGEVKAKLSCVLSYNDEMKSIQLKIDDGANPSFWLNVNIPLDVIHEQIRNSYVNDLYAMDIIIPKDYYPNDDEN